MNCIRDLKLNNLNWEIDGNSKEVIYKALQATAEAAQAAAVAPEAAPALTEGKKLKRTDWEKELGR